MWNNQADVCIWIKSLQHMTLGEIVEKQIQVNAEILVGIRDAL